MSDQKNIAVKVENLHKSFRLPHEQHTGVKQKLINILNAKKGYEEQKVLKGLSFEIQEGDFFGIVGRNGSGKSTLLKLLAGIYTPDKGSVQVNGSLTPFIELGVGFNPELTGRENLYMNGALLGFDRKQMDGMYDSIVEFAELKDFMDQKLKNYSSGMQVRLAFSIAIRAESDILLLDEVLAVGDEAFQRKCFEYFAELKRNKKTVILVTHAMESMMRFCNKALLINEGQIIAMGSPGDIGNKYTEKNILKTKETKNRNNLKIYPLSKQVLTKNDNMSFAIEYKKDDNTPVRIRFRISDQTSGALLVTDTSKTLSEAGTHTVKYNFPVALYNNIPINVKALVESVESGDTIDYTADDQAVIFAIRNLKNKNRGILKLNKDITGWWS